jgi:hypothetical protein
MRPAPRDNPMGTPVRRASLKIEKAAASHSYAWACAVYSSA